MSKMRAQSVRFCQSTLGEASPDPTGSAEFDRVGQAESGSAAIQLMGAEGSGLSLGRCFSLGFDFQGGMNSIQVYDPAMCCSTGVCGPNVDADLVAFAAMLYQFQSHGVEVQRYNLGQQPLAFVQNSTVRNLLETEGVKVLPLIFWDNLLHLHGRYPNKSERSEWYRAAHNEPQELP